MASGRALVDPRLGYALIGAMLVYGAATALAAVFGPPDFWAGGAFVVLVILPLAGIVPPVYLARPAQPPWTPATA